MIETTFVLKIASKCNLNCPYCYVYNNEFDTVSRMPKYMSDDVLHQIGKRISNYCLSHQIKKININFHGGEPLLGGVEKLRNIHEILNSELSGSNIVYSVHIQTNATLITLEILDYLLESDMQFYVSSDGTPQINDKNRVDHKGKGSGNLIDEKLKLIRSNSKYDDIFEGFLCVIDPTNSPEEIFDYLEGFNPKKMDFLLPLENYNTLKIDTHAYGEWLVKLFDKWFYGGSKTRIRFFDDIIIALIQKKDVREILHVRGQGIVIETNGEIELDDVLNTASGSSLGLNIFEHDFNDFFLDSKVKSISDQYKSLSKKCISCDFVAVCGGGQLANRYSSDNAYDNPTVYCDEMKLIISHIYTALKRELIN